MLVTLDQVKAHLDYELSFTERDDDLTLKLEQASAIVLDYIKVADDYWQDSNGVPVGVPPLITAAVLIVVDALFEKKEPLSQAVMDLVHRYRDPAMA